MSGIHDLILLQVQSTLQAALIDNPKAVLAAAIALLHHGDPVPVDPAIAGIVQIGPLQGDPTPDIARISATIHENDPDTIIGGAVTGLKSDWADEIYEVEIGNSITHYRRFSVKIRCLLVNGQEPLDQARSIASTVRERAEKALLNMSVSGIGNSDEYASRGILSDEFEGEMLQAGGPTAYDYHIKIRFSLLTTRLGA
jgi:hypothetical protein